jgi:stage II sporulation protein D
MVRRPSRVGVVLLALVLVSCAKERKPSRQGEEPGIRILLIDQTPSLVFSSPGAYVLRVGKKSKKQAAFREWTLETQSGEVALLDVKGNKKIPEIDWPIVVESREVALLNGLPYRGRLIFKRKGAGFMAINELGMEDYLRGVVACEMGAGAPLEAQKAQAVAARSYALANMGKHKNEGYDLVSTIYDQVYRGVKAECESTDRAVRETRGLILEYRGKPAEARYHSTCGGKTAGANEILSGGKLSYLRGVDDRGGHLFNKKEAYCSASPHFRWSRTWNRNEFDNLISDLIRSFFGEGSPGKIHRVKTTKTRSGRVKELVIITSGGRFKVPGDQVRRFFGGLPSTRFNIIIRGNLVKLEGGGYGHGLGMCQWGAMGMAQAGNDFRNILKHYYPGTRVRKRY